MGIRLKIKKLVTLNYLFFMLAIAYSWFHFVPTSRYLKTTVEQIDQIKNAFEQRLSLTIDLQSDSLSNYPKLFSVYNSTIKSPLEEENRNRPQTQNPTSEDNTSINFTIKCLQNDKPNTLQVQSFSDYLFTGNCDELETSKKLQREIKRVIFSLTREIDEDVTFNLAFEIIHVNVYLISSVNDKSSLTAIKNRVIDIAKPFFQKIELSQSQFRLNFQTLYLEDLSLPFKTESNTSYVLDVKDLDHFADIYPSASQEQIYVFETESINLFLFSHKNLVFDDDGVQYNYFDEKREKYAALSISQKKTDYDIQILRILYRMFDLTTLHDLSNGVDSIKLQYQTNLEFGLFNEKRAQFLTKKIISGLEAFKYMIGDSELVIEKEVGEEIDRQILGLLQLSVDGLEIQELRKIYQIIWTLNYDGNRKYGHRDSFSDEYRIGVYLPLLLPFVFPVIKALKQLRKGKKAVSPPAQG